MYDTVAMRTDHTRTKNSTIGEAGVGNGGTPVGSVQRHDEVFEAGHLAVADDVLLAHRVYNLHLQKMSSASVSPRHRRTDPKRKSYRPISGGHEPLFGAQASGGCPVLQFIQEWKSLLATARTSFHT